LDKKPIWRDVIHHDGAAWIMVHFEKFDLAPGAKMIVSSPNNKYLSTYIGKEELVLRDFRTSAKWGDTVIIEVFSEVEDAGFGYVIDGYRAGSSLPAEIQTPKEQRKPPVEAPKENMAEPSQEPAATGSEKLPIAGYHHPLHLETPHPLKVKSLDNQPIWRDVIHHEGATYIRVHFEKFELAPGAKVVISSPKDSYTFTYTVKGVLERGNFWSASVVGDTAIIEVWSKVADAGFGYVIEEYSAGIVPASPGTDLLLPNPCGADDKQHAICYRWSFPYHYERARAVARVIVRDLLGRDYYCTGALVSCNGLFVTSGGATTRRMRSKFLPAKESL
jgi:sulfur relay (sulfurtransferase) DsrC/TusE family protein